MASRGRGTIVGWIIGGLLLLVLGLILKLGSSNFYDTILRSSLSLAPDSWSFPMWVDLPAPLYMSAYLFHVENPEAVARGDEKPKLREVGPFVFQEFHHKTKLKWNENNDTLTYQQIRSWKLVENRTTEADLDRVVTILNPPAASLAFMTSKANIVEKAVISVALEVMKEKLFVEKKVREILFDGYKDPILSASEKLPPVVVPGVTDKFGFFYDRNGSDWFDGVFNIYTGAKDMSNFGQVARWNFTNHTSFFKGHCGDVRGAGDFFTPKLETAPFVELYSNDLCRPLRLNYHDEEEAVNGVYGHKFTIDSSFFANKTVNPDNWCYTRKEYPSGIYDAGPCRFEAPIFLSNPHFFDSDSFFLRQFSPESLDPQKNKHQTSFVIEPHSGVPLRIRARFQVSFLIKNVPEIKLFKHVKDTFFPVIWFENDFETTKDLANKVWFLSKIPMIFSLVGLCTIGLGVAIVTTGVIHFIGLRIRIKSEESSPILQAEIIQQEDNGGEGGEN